MHVSMSESVYRVRLAAKEAYEDIRLFRFEWMDESMSFVAGQFVQLQIASSSESVGAKRPYSIASSASESSYVDFVIAIKPGGACSSVLDTLEIGDTSVVLRGPFGHFQLQETTAPKVYVAAGTGLAPVLAMWQTVNDRHDDTQQVMIYGVRNDAQRVMHESFQKWSAQSDQQEYLPVTSGEHPWPECRPGRVTDYLEDVYKRMSVHAEYYVCGPPQMVVDAKRMLQDLGAKHIFIEAYN